ncbi:MAG TPA: ParB/RepB/Spo0J family partition protein [Nitriliruptorales bacterium]
MSATATADATSSVQMIGVAQIRLSADNRRHLGDLTALADSIAQRGVLVPLIVTPAGQQWDLVAGERRLRAAITVGLDRLPCIVRRFTPSERDETRLVENLHRHDLDPLDEAAGYQLLVDRYGYTQTQIASALAVSQSHVSKRLALLRLPDAALDELAPHDEHDDGEGPRRLTLADAYSLTRLADHPDLVVEAMSCRTPDGRTAPTVGAAVDAHLHALERAADREAAHTALAVQGVRVVAGPPDLERWAVAARLGVALLGPAAGYIRVSVDEHARRHRDGHVAVVLHDGEIVYGCDQPTHHRLRPPHTNGRAHSEQLTLDGGDDGGQEQDDVDEAAWHEAATARRIHAARAVAALARPPLGDTILTVTPTLLHSITPHRCKTACIILDLPADPAAGNGRWAAALAGAADQPHTAARVLLALMVATAEDTTPTVWRPTHLNQLPQATYLDWLTEAGWQPTNLERHILALARP